MSTGRATGPFQPSLREAQRARPGKTLVGSPPQADSRADLGPSHSIQLDGFHEQWALDFAHCPSQENVKICVPLYITETSEIVHRLLK